MRHLPARAFDNGVFIVACNQTGTNGGGLSFPGVAMVIGPNGRVLAETTASTRKACSSPTSRPRISPQSASTPCATSCPTAGRISARVLKNGASRRDPTLCGFCKCSHAIGWKLEARSWKPG